MSKDADDHSRDEYRLLWGKTCEALMHRLLAYALKLVKGTGHDAWDLVQDTIRRVLIYPKNPAEVRSPLSYLRTIMKNIWNDVLRKEAKAKTYSLDELLSKEPDQEHHRSVEPAIEPKVQQVLENEEHLAAIRAKLGPLTTREELLFELYLQDYTCKEIGEILHEDVRLVRSELNAVKAKVRSRLVKAKALKLL